jgi:hypothetical protein
MEDVREWMSGATYVSMVEMYGWLYRLGALLILEKRSCATFINSSMLNSPVLRSEMMQTSGRFSDN